jgi:hypothetical protein
MPFITQGKTNLKYILIVVILAVIVGSGILAYQYWWLPKQPITPPPLIFHCEKEADCVLTYTGEGVCAPCDFSDQSYQCVSSEKAKKLEEDRIKRHGQVLCKPCYPSPLLFKCICKENNCFKAASCEKDEDCYSEAFEELYKCENSKCTLSPGDETANWKTYKNEEYGFEVKYPPYITLKKEEVDQMELARGRLLEHLSFQFSPDPANSFWGALLIYDAENFAAWNSSEGGWVFYDLSTERWYSTGEANTGKKELSFIKEREFSPYVNYKTVQNIPVYGGFGYGDVGVSSGYNIILASDKGIIISFYSGIDINALDYRSKEVQDLQKKFHEDLPIMMRNLQFVP